MKVKLHEPTFGEEEITAFADQMRTTYVTMGKQVRMFEEQSALAFGSAHVLMCNSGSSANLLAVAALCNPVVMGSLKPGDEVIVPALSWATTVWPLIQHGLVPVFVDCDLDTYNFDYEKLEAAITPKTHAIMLVHVYGNPCDMDIIMDLAKKYDLYVIEDTCESMGATFKGKKVGTFGHVGTMSLYYSHHITTMEGGLCFTNDFQCVELMRVLRAHGWSREAEQHQKFANMYPQIDPRFLFVNLGYNLRPTEPQAVMGTIQLGKLSGFIGNRRESYIHYRMLLDKYSEYFSFQQPQENSQPSWFGFGVVLKEKCNFSVKQLTAFLQSSGIETRPIIAGNMARQPAAQMFRHRVSGTLDNCDIIMQRGFAIGCHQAITQEQREYVAQKFDEFMHDNAN